MQREEEDAFLLDAKVFSLYMWEIPRLVSPPTPQRTLDANMCRSIFLFYFVLQTGWFGVPLCFMRNEFSWLVDGKLRLSPRGNWDSHPIKKAHTFGNRVV